MEPKTEKQIEAMIEGHIELMERLDTILRRLRTIHEHCPDDHEECDTIDMSYGTVYLTYRWRCHWRDDYEDKSLSFPTSYFWDDLDTIVAEELEQRRVKNLEAVRLKNEQKAKEAALKAEAKEVRDHEKYLKLKEKYEGNNP